MDFRGKIAVVTGGARGIGAAVTKRLSALGASVVVADLLAEAEADIIEQGHYVKSDVSRAADVQRVMAEAESLGGLDILVNCAGIFPHATLAETSEALWDRVLAVNLKGAFLTCQAAAPLLARRGGGCIVNVGSLHADGGKPYLFAYSISKGGVVTLTRNLARALADQNIRVNCVHPGWVSSEGERELRQRTGWSASWVEDKGTQLPFGRLQTPKDIAELIVFLVSDEATQVTGQIIAVDGGLGLS